MPLMEPVHKSCPPQPYDQKPQHTYEACHSDYLSCEYELVHGECLRETPPTALAMGRGVENQPLT